MRVDLKETVTDFRIEFPCFFFRFFFCDLEKSFKWF